MSSVAVDHRRGDPASRTRASLDGGGETAEAPSTVRPSAVDVHRFRNSACFYDYSSSAYNARFPHDTPSILRRNPAEPPSKRAVGAVRAPNLDLA
ncbi:hypothetical protein [Halomicrococcus sp. NG-SE-24]|uniref:hypothetical protein n=1 Tax=Halomicrococcus sp. NG-SE-24 TaxID=3436928 RepID=UPI003D961FFD